MLDNYVQPKIEIIRRKIRTVYGESIDIFTGSYYLSYQRNSTIKKSWGNTFVCGFLLGIGFHTQSKDGINTIYIWSLPKNCYHYNGALQNRNAMVRPSEGDTIFFDFVTGVLQGYSLASYLLITCLNYLNINRSSKRKWFHTPKKQKNRRYFTETIRDADDLSLLANTPVQAESIPHNQEQVAWAIDLYVNSDKTKFTCFKQEWAISTLYWKPLKLLDQLIYIGSNIWYSESDINVRLAKVWPAIEKSIWNSDISDKIKHNFFQTVALSILLYRGTTWMLIHKNVMRCLEQIKDVITRKTSAVCPSTSHLAKYQSKTNKTCWAQ